MKKVAKILAVMLMVLCLGSFAACSGGTKDVGLVITANQKGYGLDWLYDLAEAYENKTGVKVQIVKKIGASGQEAVSTEISSMSGSTDIFVPTGDDFYSNLYKGSIVAADGQRYDKMFAPLDSVYATKVEGESKTIAEKFDDGVLDSYYLDGHYYGSPWFNSLFGIVLNQDAFASLGYTDADIPKTTDEMFALCDDILTKDAVNGKKVAPFIFSAINEYYTTFFQIWFAQYEGKTGFGYYSDGKDPDGNVSEYVYTFKGQERALEVLDRLIKKENGYQHEKSDELEFTDMQGWFLSNQAVFCVNGGWLDTEMENYKSKNMKFIKTPVISSIIEKLTFNTDAQLRELIDYVDAHPDENDYEGKPSFATNEDVKIVREARQMAYVGGQGGNMLIPAWSKNIEQAKDFITFMLSDEGLRIYYRSMGGGILAVKPSDGQYPEDVEMSVFRKNQAEIFLEGHVVNTGACGRTRLYTVAGVSTTYNNGMTGVPGVVLRQGGATPKQIMETNQATVSNKWSTIEKML